MLRIKERGFGNQIGLTLIGLIFVLAIVALIGVLGLKVSPAVVEFFAIKKAIVAAKSSGTSPVQIRSAFDRQTSVGYIDSITGKDLDVIKGEDGFEVSFAYPKKIEMVGPVSLLIEFEGTTATRRPTKKALQ